MIRQDYIERLIQQVGEAIARALGKAGAAEEQHAEALHRIRRAYTELGIAPAFFDLEASSLRRLLGAERARAVAQLCGLEADVRERKGELAHAEALRRRANDLSAP